MTEKVEVIDIDASKATKTLKELKSEIKTLQKELDNCELGSDKFADTLDKLTQSQAELKKATKTTNDALEGSYDALTAKMGQLKKVWKSTNDELERANIGKEIAEINTQLKSMDAEIGNHQRNVGNYKEDIIAAFDEMEKSTFDYGAALAETNKNTEITRNTLDGFTKVASGVAGGFAMVQGIMGLCGVESEEFEKVMVKLTSAMAIAQGVGGVKGLIEGYGQLKTSIIAATSGVKGFNASLSATKKAIIATGIGAFVVLIGTLIAKFSELSEKSNAAKQKQEEYNKSVEEATKLETERKNAVNKSVGEIIGKYKLLQRQWKELSTEQEKNKWIKDNTSAFNDLGLSIKDVNAAQNAFVTNSDKVIQAIKDQAKARAMAKLYEEALIKQFTAQQELEDAQKYAEQKYTTGYVPTESEIDKAQLNDDNDFGKIYRESSYWEQYVGGEGKITSDKSNSVSYTGANKLQQTYTKPFESSVKIINDEVAKIEDAFVDAQTAAEASAQAVKDVGITFDPDKVGSGSGGSTTEDDALKRAKEIAEKARQAVIDTKEEELTELKRVYDEEKKLLEQHGLDTTTLTEAYNKNVKAINDKYDKEIAEQTKASLEEQKRLYEEKVALSEKRLNKTIDSINRDAETQTYLNERRKPSGNGEINEIENELQKLETLKRITTETESAVVTAIEQEQALFDKTTERWIELEEQKQQIKADSNRVLLELDDQYAEQHEQKMRVIAQYSVNTFTQTLGAASEILSAIQQNVDTTTKAGFEKSKKLQIAIATINMLQGITTALAGAFTTKTGPWDWILAGTQAATIATTGSIQIANIKKQKYDSDSNASPSIPSINSSALMSSPVNYTTEIKDANTEEEVTDTRVYVVESDISDTVRKVQVAEEESTF